MCGFYRRFTNYHSCWWWPCNDSKLCFCALFSKLAEIRLIALYLRLVMTWCTIYFIADSTFVCLLCYMVADCVSFCISVGAQSKIRIFHDCHIPLSEKFCVCESFMYRQYRFLNFSVHIWISPCDICCNVFLFNIWHWLYLVDSLLRRHISFHNFLYKFVFLPIQKISISLL